MLRESSGWLSKHWSFLNKALSIVGLAMPACGRLSGSTPVEAGNLIVKLEAPVIASALSGRDVTNVTGSKRLVDLAGALLAGDE